MRVNGFVLMGCALLAMGHVGIGEVLIGNVVDPDTPLGDTKLLSEKWWSLMGHAVREGKRTGVDLGVFNGPGWSQSGGPWIAPTQAMRYVVSSETRVKGPLRFAGRPPAPRTKLVHAGLLGPVIVRSEQRVGNN